MTHNGKIQLLDVVGDWRIGTWNVRGLAFGHLDDSFVERRNGASPRRCLVIAASVASTHGHHHQRLLINYMLSSVSDVITDRNNLLQKIKRASFALIPYAHIKRAQDVLHLMLILVRCQNLFSRKRQHCFVVRSLRSPRSDSWLPIQISSHGTCFRPALSP